MPTFAVLAHTDPAQLGRLVERLSPHPVVVHVDARVPLRPFEGLPRTRYVDNRIEVHWAGYSVAEAMRSVLEAAAEQTADDDHVVLLSGQCYPARPVEAFVEHLRTTPYGQHCAAAQVFDDAGYSAERLRRQWLYDVLPREGNPLARRARGGLRRLAAAILPRRQPALFSPMVPVAGSMHVALTAGCVRDVLARWQSEPAVRLFRRALAPDEMVLQSLLYNSPWVSDTPVGRIAPRGQRLSSSFALLHYTDPLLQGYRGLGDLPAIRASGRFFTRKVSSTHSGALLDALDRHIETG